MQSPSLRGCGGVYFLSPANLKYPWSISALTRSMPSSVCVP